MTDIADDPRFQRDRELYRVISRAQFCPVVWKITPEEGATLGERLAKLFPSPAGPMLRVRFELPAPAPDAAADKHAPLLRAIRQSGKRSA